MRSFFETKTSKKIHRAYTRWVRKFNKNLVTDNLPRINDFVVKEVAFHPRHQVIIYEIIDKKTNSSRVVRINSLIYSRHQSAEIWWAANNFVIDTRVKENW